MIAHLLDRTGLWQRPAPQPDGEGGWQEAWTAGEAVRLRLSPESPLPEDFADRPSARLRLKAYLLSSLAVRVGDRLLVDDRDHRVLAVGLAPPGAAFQAVLVELREDGSS